MKTHYRERKYILNTLTSGLLPKWPSVKYRFQIDISGVGYVLERETVYVSDQLVHERESDNIINPTRSEHDHEIKTQPHSMQCLMISVAIVGAVNQQPFQTTTSQDRETHFRRRRQQTRQTKEEKKKSCTKQALLLKRPASSQPEGTFPVQFKNPNSNMLHHSGLRQSRV